MSSLETRIISAESQFWFEVVDLESPYHALLGRPALAKQRMVGALKVHHFKPNWLLAEMILVSKEDINLGLADWRAGKARNYAMEYSPTWGELLLLDSQLLHCVTIQDIDAAAAVYQDSGETGCSPLHCMGCF